MYGLVNRAIKDLVVSEHGEEAWHRVRTAAGVEADDFVRMDQYPDKITTDLVGAVSDELSVSEDKVLEIFGAHWVKFTGQAGYGDLFEMGGDNLFDFLENLDLLHTRVGLNMKDLRPPSFEVDERTDKSMALHYHSQREGLAPMVFGLLRGLGEHFDVEIDVQLRESRTKGADHDVFVITLK